MFKNSHSGKECGQNVQSAGKQSWIKQVAVEMEEKDWQLLNIERYLQMQLKYHRNQLEMKEVDIDDDSMVS